jgi:hypothetical protein
MEAAGCAIGGVPALGFVSFAGRAFPVKQFPILP